MFIGTRNWNSVCISFRHCFVLHCQVKMHQFDSRSNLGASLLWLACSHTCIQVGEKMDFCDVNEGSVWIFRHFFRGFTEQALCYLSPDAFTPSAAAGNLIMMFTMNFHLSVCTSCCLISSYQARIASLGLYNGKVRVYAVPELYYNKRQTWMDVEAAIWWYNEKPAEICHIAKISIFSLGLSWHMMFWKQPLGYSGLAGFMSDSVDDSCWASEIDLL